MEDIVTKKCKFILSLGLALFIVSVVVGAHGREYLSTGCSGNIHLVPVLKDTWSAYTSISCNGVDYSTMTNAEIEAARRTCYTYTTIEVWGILGGYDNAFKELIGASAFDIPLNGTADAGVRGATKVESKHRGHNRYTTSDLTETRTWSK